MRSHWITPLGTIAIALICSLPASGQTPLEELERLIDDGAEPPPPPAADAPESTVPAAASGYLGVVVDDRTRTTDGVNVLAVKSGTPAAAAGLRSGDRIVAVDGAAIRTIDDFSAAAALLRPGREVPVEVVRGRVHFEFKVTPAGRDVVGAKPAVPIAPTPSVDAPPAVVYKGGRPMLGLSIAPVRSVRYPLLGFAAEWGVIVEGLVPGSPAERSGVPRGAIITGLNGERIDSVRQLMACMERVDPTRPVELTYVLAGRTYRQLIPLGGEPKALAAPPALPAPPAPPKDPPAALPPALPPPEPPPERADKVPAEPDADARVKAMQAELETLRRRADELERAIGELKKD